MFPELVIQLPNWVLDELPEPGQPLPSLEERMQLAIHLSRRNVEEKAGGPFAALVFDAADHTLVAPGVNLVEKTGSSLAHAELVALALAQRLLGSWNLAAVGSRRYELVTSTEPCAMCLGALSWSGIAALACGARDEDARLAGFDEGDKPAGWTQRLLARGITVKRDACREDASQVLATYAADGGVIYQPRPSAPLRAGEHGKPSEE